MSYPLLAIEETGRNLLETEDLDPVYVALWKLRDTWTQGQVRRWLVAYWCLYHVGAACHLSTLEGRAFWDGLMAAAKNEELAPNNLRWPRGHERRHFRGRQGASAVAALAGRYESPEHMVDYIMGAGEYRTFKEVSNRAQEHQNFGPWIGFKISDMIDRVFGVRVDFTEAEVFMFKDPVEAAVRLWRKQTGYGPEARPKNLKTTIHDVVNYLRKTFEGFKAPPNYDRPVDLQEIETILCKWKSHLNGHYPLLCDIHEIGAGLTLWTGVCPAAAQFQQCMPNGLPVRGS